MAMAGAGDGKSEEYVYRISSAKEWQELQTTGFTFGGDLDKSTACFHLSTLNQVQPTLQRFFTDADQDLYLLQIDSKKLGDGLIYELVEETHWFPHFYGPSRSFAPLPLDAVTKADKLNLSNAYQRESTVLELSIRLRNLKGTANRAGFCLEFLSHTWFFVSGDSSVGRASD